MVKFLGINKIKFFLLFSFLFLSLTPSVKSDSKPFYSLNSTNSTLAGAPVSHNLFWQDDYGLSHYLFSFDNCTGVFVNDTWKRFNKTGITYTQSCQSTGSAICKTGFECSRTFDCRASTCSYSCPAPKSNSTLVSNNCVAGTSWSGCNCSNYLCTSGSGYCTISGNCYYECDIGYYWNGTDCEPIKSDWSNVTKIINSTVGCTIRWCVYANDTSGNWNSSCEDPFSYVTTPFLSITVISPENKTYNTSFFWANISLDRFGSVALYSLDNQQNQTLIKLNDTYFYEKVYSTKGNHKIIFYVNDTEGNMVSSSIIYFYLNVTGYTTVEISRKKCWWNDLILAYGRAVDYEGNGISDSKVNINIQNVECENYTDSDGNWFCSSNAPNEIKNHLLNVNVAGISNYTYLKVSPFYGLEEKNVEKRIYEIPMIIQDKNGKIKSVWLRITKY